MDRKLYKQFAAKDTFDIVRVVEYIHQYIKFTSKVDNVSHQIAMDKTFDWIVERVNEEHEKENIMEKNKITYEDYDLMWFDLREGKITEEEWREFCDELFKQELERNKDVMIRLKNR